VGIAGGIGPGLVANPARSGAAPNQPSVPQVANLSQGFGTAWGSQNEVNIWPDPHALDYNSLGYPPDPNVQPLGVNSFANENPLYPNGRSWRFNNPAPRGFASGGFGLLDYRGILPYMSSPSVAWTWQFYVRTSPDVGQMRIGVSWYSADGTFLFGGLGNLATFIYISPGIGPVTSFTFVSVAVSPSTWGQSNWNAATFLQPGIFCVEGTWAEFAELQILVPVGQFGVPPQVYQMSPVAGGAGTNPYLAIAGRNPVISQRVFGR
jgi:hypothetical protein